MNENDDTLAGLFVDEELDTDRAAFVEAVRRRVAVEQRRETAIRVGSIVLGAAIAVVAIGVVPDSLVNPMLLLSRLVSPEIALGGGIVGAVGLTWWSRFVDPA